MMRHSLEYGLLNLIDLSDEKIKAKLPKAALEELQKTGGRKTHPAAFLCQKVIEDMEPGTEFTVNDMYVLLHQGQPEIVVKMGTLRSTLSNLSRRDKSGIKVASQIGKHRLYVKT